MSSREKILKEITQHKPAELPLPLPFVAEKGNKNLLEEFLRVLESIGGRGEAVDDWAHVQSALQEWLAEGMSVVNNIAKLSPYNAEQFITMHANELETTHAVLIEGKLAVAENAAVWVTETGMVNRIMPFICQHLMIVIREEDIVANMHDAYAALTVDEEGYGVFIAGPSKTADIEQSLVIGAHGPLALLVFILRSQQAL